MSFTIPNNASAGDTKQAQLDKVDFDVITAGTALNGVITGCAVTAQGTPNMTVAVSAGSAIVNGIVVAVTAGNVTIVAADATNPRFDLIAVDNTGAKSRVAGTAAAAPVFPAIPANSVILAAVFVPANDTAIDANQIVDKRVTTPIQTRLAAVAHALPVGQNPYGLCINSTGTRAYVANGSTAGTVTVVDLVNRTIVATIAVGALPRGIAISPDDSKVYVCNFNGNTVSVITTASNTVTATITVGTGPMSVCFTPNGAKAYVSNNTANTVTPITVSTDTALTAVAVGAGPHGLVSNGTSVFVANQSGGTVSVITVATDVVASTIAGVGATTSSLQGIALNLAGTKLYVVAGNDNGVYPVTIAGPSVGSIIPTGFGPHYIAITADGVTAWVSNNGASSLTPITTATDVPGELVMQTSSPQMVAIAPNGDVYSVSGTSVLQKVHRVLYMNA